MRQHAPGHARSGRRSARCRGTYGFVPQAVKCWRTGETEAISLRMFAVRAFGLLLWTIYGFAVWSLPVLIFSALGLLFSCIILGFKLREPQTREGNRRAVSDPRLAGLVAPFACPAPRGGSDGSTRALPNRD